MVESKSSSSHRVEPGNSAVARACPVCGSKEHSRHLYSFRDLCALTWEEAHHADILSATRGRKLLMNFS
jgi:hypothetical protein